LDNHPTALQASSAKPTAEVLTKTRQFVTFTIAEQQYCVDIMAVREIRASNVITPLPGAPAFVRGVTNLRGTIVPIIDLGKRFGISRPESTPSQVVVIVAMEGKLAGLLVDTVSDILTVSDTDIAAIPATQSEKHSTFFDGLITLEETMIIVISLDRLSSPLRENPGSMPPGTRAVDLS
jgi:purine-binding chemotaxis protein CheW